MAGKYGDDVIPHLTLDRGSPAVTPATVYTSVARLLPLTVSIDRIDLQWWANHDCRRLGTWPRPELVCRRSRWAVAGSLGSVMEVLMKKLVELLLCILHPLAVVLMWINLLGRRDLSTVGKLAWAVFGLIPLVPFLYVLTGGDLF
jgi:hypothetical protein